MRILGGVERIFDSLGKHPRGGGETDDIGQGIVVFDGEIIIAVAVQALDRVNLFRPGEFRLGQVGTKAKLRPERPVSDFLVTVADFVFSVGVQEPVLARRGPGQHRRGKRDIADLKVGNLFTSQAYRRRKRYYQYYKTGDIIFLFRVDHIPIIQLTTVRGQIKIFVIILIMFKL